MPAQKQIRPGEVAEDVFHGLVSRLYIKRYPTRTDYVSDTGADAVPGDNPQGRIRRAPQSGTDMDLSNSDV